MSGGSEDRDLPEIIAAARRERSLDLTDAGHGTIPFDLADVANVRFLHLAGNGLRELPRGIGALRHLIYLDLRNNRLSALSPEIGSLPGLQTLLMSGNRLTGLPDEIGDLTGLTQMHLANNRLASLPTGLGNLTRLTEIDVDGNALRELPPSVGDLPQLQVLRVGQNDLQSLPSELAASVRGGLLIRGLDTNPSLAHLDGLDRWSLASYLESLSDAVGLFEGKLLLVGEGEVGKSSLVRSLTGEPFVDGLLETRGVDIRSIEVPHPDRDGQTIVLHGWDFGGQAVYRITNQFFFTPGALYLVVWNARMGARQCDVEGWLRRIRGRIGSGASVLLVATHSTVRPEIDYSALREQFPTFLQGMLPVENSDGRGVTQLRSAISRAAAELPIMGQLVSSRWLAAREAVIAEAEEQPYITYAEFVRLCTRSGLGPLAVPAMAELLHELGDIVHYGDDDSLREIVVLDPEWLTKAISFVLDDEVTNAALGVLDHTRLREIWRGPGADDPDGAAVPYPADSHRYILRLMERFEISFRLDDADRPSSLVAQMVPHQRPEELPWDPAVPGPHSLRLLCETSDEAPGLISWLTVRWHTHSGGLHWRRGVFLRHPIEVYESEAVFEQAGDRKLWLTVRAPAPDLYFNTLRDGLETVLRRRWPGLTYELFVPCPTIRNATACDGLFKFSGLLRARGFGKSKVECHECWKELDVLQLLTGFSVPVNTTDERLQKIQQQVTTLLERTDRIGRNVTESADLVRRTLVAIGTEVADCPRLFTISTTDGSAGERLRSVAKVGYRLHLWCEHPGSWHICRTDPYTFRRPREWIVRIAPYVHLLVRTLKLVVPIAKDVAGVLVSEEELKASKTELDLMKTLADKLPEPGTPGSRPPAVDPFQLLEGAALRNFRTFLLEIDSTRTFAGLRRVMQPSGEYSWVCENHLTEYYPGLPPIPA